MEETLRKIIEEKNPNNHSFKYLETCDGSGLAPSSFCGNGLVSLLWAIENFHLGLGTNANINIKN